MEVQNPASAIESLLKNKEVKAYFTEAELLKVADDMVKTMREVLGDKPLKSVTFHDDEQMFFSFKDNSVHLGLGIVKNMAHTWHENLSAGGTAHIFKELVREKIIASLQGDAAHEAGHRVIDRDPIDVLGESIETWTQLGFSSHANAVLDCRNDQRIMKHHPELKSAMDAALEFSFGPGGRLDWVGKAEQVELEQGHVPLFFQHSSELIRTWVYGQGLPQVDVRVGTVIDQHRDLIDQVAHSPAYVPKKNPSELEVKAKGKKVAAAIKKVYEEGVKDLVEKDEENQMVHQAITVVGLQQNNYPLPQSLQTLIEDELKILEADLKAELEDKLAEQREEKVQWEKEQHPVEQISKETTVDIKGVIDEEKKATVVPPTDPLENPLNILGPAVLVEEISSGLREWLKELFKKLQQKAEQEMISQLIKQLLEDPEECLKAIEDFVSQSLRPHTKPPTNPTHEESEQQPEKPAQPQPSAPKLINPGGDTSMIDQSKFSQPDRGELEAAEAWIDKNLDMTAIIAEWKEAIRAYSQKGRKKTDRPSHELHGPTMVQNEIRKKIGHEIEGKMFLEKDQKREKICCSILWRTQALDLQEALKLMLFLMRIYEDPEIKRYLNLEVLVSQSIPNLQHQESSPVPVILSFGQDPILDREVILGNIMALKKAGEGGSALTIVQDATALKTQRERLLHNNPSSKRRFSIDLWDEAAVESGVSDPLKAVHEQIDQSQEQLHGKAFCFVMKQGNGKKSTQGAWYGEDHYMTSNSTADLIPKLDKVLKSMVKYNECHASRVREELGS